MVDKLKEYTGEVIPLESSDTTVSPSTTTIPEGFVEYTGEVIDPSRPNYGLGELTSKSLQRGFKRTSSLIGDVIPAIGLSALGFDEAARRQMMEAQATEEAIQRDLPAQFPSFRDVEWTNPADVGRFVIEKMGENATNLIPILGLGSYGAKKGAEVGAKKALAKLVDKNVSTKARNRILTSARAKGADLGQIGGVFLGSYSLNTPETFRGIYEETGNFEVGASLLAGVVNASLDSIFPVTLLRGFSQPTRATIVSKILQRSGMNPSLANSAVTKVFGSAALEGLTEGSQEAVNITAENFVQDHSFAFDSKDYDRILEGAVAGTAAGGGFRATGEVVNKVRKEISEYRKDKPPSTTPPTTTTPEEGAEVTEEDAKVRQAQKLNEQQVAERLEREALQSELDEKILTFEGVEEVLANMDRYFSGSSKAELNTIRNDLRRIRANLKKTTAEQDVIILQDLSQEVTEKVKPKVDPKVETKPDSTAEKLDLKQRILEFVNKSGEESKIVSPNSVAKELKINFKKARAILDELTLNGEVKFEKSGAKRQYKSLTFIPLPEKKDNYAGIKKASRRAIPLKVGKSTKREGQFSGQASTAINHMLSLVGALGVSATNMDVNLQKRLVREYNKVLSEKPRATPDKLTEDIKFQSGIDNNFYTQIFSQQTLDALKEYGQETRDDYNFRKGIRGATADIDETGARTSTKTPVRAAVKASAKTVTKSDRDAVATTGPDTGQLTGAERGIYPSLGGQNFTEGKKITVKTPMNTTRKGFYRVENTPDGPQGTVVYSRIGQEPGIESIYPEDIVTLDKQPKLIKQPKEKNLKTSNVEQSKTEFKPSEYPELTNGRNKKDLAPSEKGDFELSGGQQEGTITNPVRKQRKFDKINYTKGIQFTVLPQTLENTYGKKTLSNIRIVETGTNWAGAHHNGGIALQGLWPYAVPVGPNVVAHELGHAAHSLLGKKINNNLQVFGALPDIEEFLYPDLRTTVENAIAEGKELNNDDIEFFNYLLSPEELIAEFNVLRMADPSTAKAVSPFIVEQFESVDKAPNLVKVRKTFPTGFGSIVAKAPKAFDNNYTKLHAAIGKAKKDREKLKTTQKGDPRDAEIINKLKPKTTLGQVLTILDKENITATQKELVTILLALPNIKDVKFNIVKDSDLDVDTFGEYDVADNFIRVGVSGDVQTVLHEATHAATANQLTKHISRGGVGKTEAGKELVKLYNTTVEAIAGRGFTNELENIDEFIAGAFNNPDFQRVLARIESPKSDEAFLAGVRDALRDKGATTREIRNTIESYRDRPLAETIDSAWTGFVESVMKIIKPRKDLDIRSSVLNDVIALAPELFVGPDPVEQARGPQGVLFKKGEESKTISELPVKPLTVNIKQTPNPKVLYGNADNEISEFNVDTVDVEKALNDVDDLKTQAAGENIVTPEEERLRAKHDVDIVNEAEFASGDAAPLSISEPSYFRRQFDAIADFIKGLPIAQSGAGERLANGFANIPDALGRIYAGFLSLGQLDELHGDRLPGIKLLKAAIERKADINKVGLEAISNVMQYVDSIVSPYRDTPSGQQILSEWNDVLFRLSEIDVDPDVILNDPNGVYSKKKLTEKDINLIESLVGKDVAKVLIKENKNRTDDDIITLTSYIEDLLDGNVSLPPNYVIDNGSIFTIKTNQQFFNENQNVQELIARYQALPEDLKDAARRMVNDMRERYTELLEAMIRKNPESEQKLRRQFAMKKYYLPFVRRGEYWYSYIDTETGRKGYGSAASASERRIEMKKIKDEGIGTNVQISSRAKAATAGINPTGGVEIFKENVEESLKQLDLSGMNEQEAQQIIEEFRKTLNDNFLNLYPDQSLRQQQRHRAAVPGYIKDITLAYSDAAPKMVRSLANTETNSEVIRQINAIQNDAAKPENKDNKLIQGIAASTLNRAGFFLNPVAKGYAALAAYGSYYWFLGFNLSSAVINYTQLPLVVFPFLESEYGPARSFGAMRDMHKLYFKGGLEQTKFQTDDGKFIKGRYLNDYSMAPFRFDFKTGEKIYIGPNAELFAPKGAKIEIQDKDGKVIETKIAKENGIYFEVFDAAEKSQTIRRGISYEATEKSRQTGVDFEKPNRTGAKIDTAVGWMFQNSERLNREVTVLSAFELEMEKQLGKNWKNLNKNSKEYKQAQQIAIDKAIDLTVRAHSHALPEAGPEYFQDGIPKVMTVFKRFAQQQMYLVAKLFLTVFPKSGDYVDPNTGKKLEGEALDKYREERRIAARRLIGIYAASIALAGIQGAPLYGIVKMLAELVLDDEDDPFDLDTVIAQEFGNTIYGGPLNKALGIDISRRTGFRDMVFRTDEARLEEIGFTLYALETLGGPTVGALTRIQEGVRETFGDEGFNVRSTEKMLPTAIGNVLKSYRQGMEGVVNKRGVTIADDPNLYQSMMQIFGFTSYEVSQAYKKANALKGPERKLYKRRSRLLLEYWLASTSGDTDGLQDVQDEIREFNSKAPRGFRISQDTIIRSMQNRRKIERRATFGVDVKNVRELEAIYGIMDD